MFTVCRFVAKEEISPVLHLFFTTALLLVSAVNGVAQSAFSITDGYVPEGLKTGRPAGSFQLTGFDNINYFNGNLNFSLPLLTIGGRGGAGYTINLRIETKWGVSSYRNPRVINTPTYHRDGWNSINGDYGPGLVLERHGSNGEINYEDCNSSGVYRSLTRLDFITPDGTGHELRDIATNGAAGLTVYQSCAVTQTPNRGKIFKSADDSGLTFISDSDILDWPMRNGASGYLLLPDGGRYRVEDGLVKRIRDRNGNLIFFTHNNDRRVSEITDSLNRRVTFTYVYTQGNPDYHLISYQGVGGAQKTIIVRYRSLSQALREGSVKLLGNYFLNKMVAMTIF
jgi:hypothetical protein